MINFPADVALSENLILNWKKMLRKNIGRERCLTDIKGYHLCEY